jgi:MinD superfamily P-loop ATPase
MKKIAITGGKGGTGKSTIAVLLALKHAKQGKKIILVDCDVECPNDYLILGEKIGKPQKKVYTQFPKISEDKCLKCGKCVNVCQEHALFNYPKKFLRLLKNCAPAVAPVPWSAQIRQSVSKKK